MDLTERKLRILQAIITDYVQNAEPVGSRSIAKKYDFGVSPATIRNEMADLEEMGYLTHPHTSAGRVPSDKAYRLYVNNMMQKTDLSLQEKQTINERLQVNRNEFDRTIRHAAELLSDITKLASFAMTPSTRQDTLKFIRLLPIDDDKIVLMIVADSGKVTNTTLRLNVPYTNDALEILSKTMTYHYKGHTIDDVLKNSIIEDVGTDLGALSSLAGDVMPNFMRTLEDMLNVNLYMEGLTNIFNIPEYSDMDRAKSFLELVGGIHPGHSEPGQRRNRHHRQRESGTGHEEQLRDYRHLPRGWQAGGQNRRYRADPYELQRGHLDYGIFDKQPQQIVYAEQWKG